MNSTASFARALRRAGLVLVPVLGLPSLAAADDNPATAPKTHVLFMGTDLALQRDGKLYRVEDVNGSTLMIRVGQQEVFVPTRQGPLGFQVKPGLRLTDTSATLAELKTGPAYTWENDPARKFKETADTALNLQYAKDIADTNLARDLHNVTVAEDVLNHSTGAEDRAWNQQALDRANITALNSQRFANSIDGASLGDQGNLGAGAHQAQVAEGGYDAMEVSFKISSPDELTNPFMVILFHFHDPAARPGVNGLLIHVQALEPIDATPRFVRVLKGGLPRGFAFVSCLVHLYSRGREVATNVSENRVEMTHDETRQYVVMEHIGAHKTDTLAAAALSGSLPRARRAGLSHDQLVRTLYAKIAPDGMVRGVYADKECAHPLDDDSAAAAVAELLFQPALDHGKPIEGVARVRLAGL